jgi:hypothetical protein
MNRKFLKFIYNNIISKSLSIFAVVIILLQLQNACILNAEENTPKVNMGAGGLFGVYNVNSYGNDKMDWDPGLGYGGGIVFESMFSKTFGIHSGLWFYHSTLILNFPEKDTGSDEKIKHTIKSNMLNIPVYLITSIDSSVVTFNLLYGLTFSYIAESYMKPTPEENGQNSYSNVKKYLGYGQIGAGAGIEFLFKITKFTRLFIAFTGEYYFINIIPESEDGSVNHLYDVNVRAGIMLSTF